MMKLYKLINLINRDDIVIELKKR